MLDELIFNGQCKKGDTGPRVKVIQEWLGLHGFNVVIDGVYGPATELAVKDFQKTNNLVPTGLVDSDLYAKLVYPMVDAITPIIPPKNAKLGDMMIAYAKQHLRAGACEVGGQNRGPWVRLYMDGKEGADWPWCAGFVSFILKQACDALNRPLPFATSPSCYIMAMNAKDKKMYRHGSELGAMRGENLTGAIFFVRSGNQWSHTGIVIEAKYDAFYTVEGNTNDDGSAEGYEVCKRIRNYDGKDFILLA
jgi:hypothetical protein